MGMEADYRYDERENMSEFEENAIEDMIEQRNRRRELLKAAREHGKWLKHNTKESK